MPALATTVPCGTSLFRRVRTRCRRAHAAAAGDACRSTVRGSARTTSRRLRRRVPWWGRGTSAAAREHPCRTRVFRRARPWSSTAAVDRAHRTRTRGTARRARCTRGGGLPLRPRRRRGRGERRAPLAVAAQEALDDHALDEDVDDRGGTSSPSTMTTPMTSPPRGPPLPRPPPCRWARA